MHTTYVGTYDWPGERYREHRLADSLTEIDVPLSAQHFRVVADWCVHARAATIIDTTFPILGRLSGEFVARARSAVRDADIVVFSHPWVYPLLADEVDQRRQFLVYDSHNAEALLRAQLLGDAPFNAEVAKCVAMAECFLVRSADLVLGCSRDDVDFFRASYRVPGDRFEIVPNGVFVEHIQPPRPADKLARKTALNLATGVAIFLGSDYGPNREAARFIVESLAPALPLITFAICGGVAHGWAGRSDLPGNVRLSETLDDDQKLSWLQAADVALNPVFSGSGTNIKMFDYMAAGLPVVATPVGARGITDETHEGVFVCAAEAISAQLAQLLSRGEDLAESGRCNRRWVEQDYAWERLSPALGATLRARWAARSTPADRLPIVCAAQSATREPSGVFRSSRTGERPGPRIAILSTFGIKCGIAEYTSYLAQALRAEGAQVWVLGNLLDQHEVAAPALHVRLDGVQVERVWHYDHVTHSRSEVDQEPILRVLKSSGVTHLSVQYHRAFLSERMLLDLVASAKQAGVGVSVTLHNSTCASPELLAKLAGLEVMVLVHNSAEEARLRAAGIRRVYHLPLGVPELAVARLHRETDSSAGPVISTFGFLRPHKGLLELLAALNILREVWPAIRLYAQTALYPAAESAEYLERVQARIAELRLRDHVAVEPRFLPIDEAVGRLAESDVVVLPYDARSDEGSSAAAAAALAARRPIVVTRASIFDDIRHAVYTAESNLPPALAVAVATVCSNPPLYRHLEALAADAATEREWKAVARRFLQLTADKVELNPQAA
jgi:glycosyltransferase involved in cell wall biosynthesis